MRKIVFKQYLNIKENGIEKPNFFLPRLGTNTLGLKRQRIRRRTICSRRTRWPINSDNDSVTLNELTPAQELVNILTRYLQIHFGGVQLISIVHGGCGRLCSNSIAERG